MPSSFPQHVCIVFYPRACPGWSQLWGNVRRLPPANLLTKYACSCKHTEKHRHGAHAHTDLMLACTYKHTCWQSIYTQRSGRNLITQRAHGIDFCLSSVVVSSGLAQPGLMREHPQQHYGLSRLHFWGAGKPEGQKDPVLSPSHSSDWLFFLYPFSFSKFIYMLERFKQHGVVVAFIDTSRGKNMADFKHYICKWWIKNNLR